MDCALEETVTMDGKLNSTVLDDQFDLAESTCGSSSCQNNAQVSEQNKGQVQVPKLRKNLSKHEVPLLFREPYVETGFRPLHQPWSFYVLSIFSLHNESMNVWTHLIAMVVMIRKLLHFSGHLDFISDPYTWPLLAGMICGVLMYLCSSAAHCCQSKSEFVHYVAFMVDYSGIGLYGLGSVIVHLMYCSEDVFFYMVQPFFIPLGSLLAILICYCCTVAKVTYTRPYPFVRKIWQMAPVGGVYVVLIAPIVHRLFMCYVYDVHCSESIDYHMKQMFLFALSGFFFASDIPQRWRPGKCDYFLHSHQLFHIAISLCIFTQMDAVLIDFQTREALIRGRPEPSLFSAFGPVVMVIGVEAVCVLYFAMRMYSTLHIVKFE